MTESQAKILECSTGDFGVQAGLYGGLLVDAYRAANVQVQVSDMRAAVEKHNDDGSIDVLVAVRVKVTNPRPPTRSRDIASGSRWLPTKARTKSPNSTR